MPETPPPDDAALRWTPPEQGRLIGRGHAAGDFLQAYDWDILHEDVGHLRLLVPVPDHVRNPRGQLFGGFTPTYVDLVALFTARAGPDRASSPDRRGWLATTQMRLDYFEPITGPTMEIDSRIEKRRGRTIMVLTRFLQDGELAVLATTTMRQFPPDGPLGDA